MGKRIDLLVIDPQVDFCRPGQDAKDPARGALYVDNAENDMKNVALLVERYGTKIKRIHVTLDCHHLIDIAHPQMWRNSNGERPGVFTIFGSKEIRDGVWKPIFPSLTKRFIEYCTSLETTGRYPLCIWPPHCLIGSEGNNVFPILFNELKKWEEDHHDNIDYVSKGSNPFTEHYSAVKAEVPDPDDATTQLNTRFIKTLMEADEILIAGEAGSHCVKNTVEDIADGFGDDTYIKKMILLEDGVSPVQSPFVDFPAIQMKFIKDMKDRGMKTAATTDF